MKVQVAFDLSANGVGDYFTLDDTTKGVLDNVTYLLGGDVLVDLTDRVRAVQVKRGRNRQLERFTAGAANITFDNRDRYLDPTYDSSPHFGSIVPGKQVIIEHDNQLLYTGQVADWNLDYDIGGDSTAEASCVDGFASLARHTLTDGTATPQATGARINAALTDVSWPLTRRSISAGQGQLGSDVIAPETNALTYMQQVEASEYGALFVSKSGSMTFRDRNDLQAYTSNVQFGPSSIPFTAIDVEYGSEELYNTVTVTYNGGTVLYS